MIIDTNGSRILKARGVKEYDGGRVRGVWLDAAVDETNQSGQELSVQVGDERHDVLENHRRLVSRREAVREVREAAGRVTARGLAAGSG